MIVASKTVRVTETTKYRVYKNKTATIVLVMKIVITTTVMIDPKYHYWWIVLQLGLLQNVLVETTISGIPKCERLY